MAVVSGDLQIMPSKHPESRARKICNVINRYKIDGIYLVDLGNSERYLTRYEVVDIRATQAL